MDHVHSHFFKYLSPSLRGTLRRMGYRSSEQAGNVCSDLRSRGLVSLASRINREIDEHFENE